jgi:hypothetical protein
MYKNEVTFIISKIDNGWLLTLSTPGLMDEVHYGADLEMIFSYIRMHEGKP